MKPQLLIQLYKLIAQLELTTEETEKVINALRMKEIFSRAQASQIKS